MIPVIMAALSMLQKKAQNENQNNQNLASSLQNQQGFAAQNTQLPTINSVFGQY